MPRRRTIRSLPRFKESPYPDGSITFKSFLWEIYHEPISMAEDERIYSNGLVRFLEKNAILIERYTKYEREIEDDEDNYIFSGGYTLYLYKDNLIPLKDQDDGAVTVDSYYPTSRKCVLDEFKQFLIKEKGESKVSILVMRNGNLSVQKVSFSPPSIPDLELNYGRGFKEKYDTLVKQLEMRKSGIILMHGSAGSGKSTMLKHLSSFVDREWIFCPVNLADKLASPDFISLLMSKKEAILILEDAEQAVQSRETAYDSGSVSTLLNLSDGILGSLLSITCIISFNFNRDGIDPALMRPGRLLMDIDFPALSVEDAQRLSDKLGFKRKIDRPMTLAEVYNQEANSGHVLSPKKQMGFHTLISPTPKSGPTSDKVGSEQKS